MGLQAAPAPVQVDGGKGMVSEQSQRSWVLQFEEGIQKVETFMYETFSTSLTLLSVSYPSSLTLPQLHIPAP
jgi:hypothetical protein